MIERVLPERAGSPVQRREDLGEVQVIGRSIVQEAGGVGVLETGPIGRDNRLHLPRPDNRLAPALAEADEVQRAAATHDRDSHADECDEDDG